MTVDSQRYEGRATRAIVNLDTIAANLGRFRQQVGSKTRLMVVVKANGYGHGAVMVARTAMESGATDLAVATVDEGVQLRSAGIDVPILILGPIDESEIARSLSARLAMSVADPDIIRAIARSASDANVGPASVHLKIDTGMRRYGSLPENGVQVANLISSLPELRLAGTFTHFASADETDELPTIEQFRSFISVVRDIRAHGLEPGVVHAANSAATLRSRDYDCDMVRLGIAMYGLPPSAEITLWPELRPALTIRSRLRRVFSLRMGEGVSYGGTYRAESDERAGLVPIGYADGYHRTLSNRAWMSVDNEMAPVRGKVCMDQTVVGLSVDSPATIGSDVVVVGDGIGAAPTLSQLAAIAGTIPYELATALAPRVPRHYVRHGRVVAIETLAGLRCLPETPGGNNEAAGSPVAFDHP